MVGMASQGSDHRSSSVQGTNIRSVEPADVHAGFCTFGKHVALASLPANVDGLYGRIVGNGPVPRWLCDHGPDAVGRILAVPLRCAVSPDIWPIDAVVLALSHDVLQPRHRLQDRRIGACSA